jgi:hypothetical protein
MFCFVLIWMFHLLCSNIFNRYIYIYTLLYLLYYSNISILPYNPLFYSSLFYEFFLIFSALSHSLFKAISTLSLSHYSNIGYPMDLSFYTEFISNLRYFIIPFDNYHASNYRPPYSGRSRVTAGTTSAASRTSGAPTSPPSSWDRRTISLPLNNTTSELQTFNLTLRTL